jgi:hypothetical protein
MGETCSSHGAEEKLVGCDTVIGNLQRKRPPEGSGQTGLDNIKAAFQEILCGLDSSVCGFCEDDGDDEHSGSLKDRKFSYPAQRLSVSQGIVCPIQFR